MEPRSDLIASTGDPRTLAQRLATYKLLVEYKSPHRIEISQDSHTEYVLVIRRRAGDPQVPVWIEVNTNGGVPKSTSDLMPDGDVTVVSFMTGPSGTVNITFSGKQEEEFLGLILRGALYKE